MRLPNMLLSVRQSAAWLPAVQSLELFLLKLETNAWGPCPGLPLATSPSAC